MQRGEAQQGQPGPQNCSCLHPGARPRQLAPHTEPLDSQLCFPVKEFSVSEEKVVAENLNEISKLCS